MNTNPPSVSGKLLLIAGRPRTYKTPQPCGTVSITSPAQCIPHYASRTALQRRGPAPPRWGLCSDGTNDVVRVTDFGRYYLWRILRVYTAMGPMT